MCECVYENVCVRLCDPESASKFSTLSGSRRKKRAKTGQPSRAEKALKKISSAHLYLGRLILFFVIRLVDVRLRTRR